MFCSWISLLCHLISANEATGIDGSFLGEGWVESEMAIPHWQVGGTKHCLCYQRTRNSGVAVLYPPYATFTFPVSPNKPWMILCPFTNMLCILFHYYLCSVTIQFSQSYENILVEWSASFFLRLSQFIVQILPYLIGKGIQQCTLPSSLPQVWFLGGWRVEKISFHLKFTHFRKLSSKK